MRVAFLHGPPASGKYTIGLKLSELTKLPLFHNHLAVDAAISLFAFGTPGFRRLRATIWRAAFAEAAAAHQSFIFTFNPESTVDPGLIQELCAQVQASGGTIDFVELTCSRETILARMGNESRAKFGKLTDARLFQAIEAQGAFSFPALPKARLLVDTDMHDAESAARMIAKVVFPSAGDA